MDNKNRGEMTFDEWWACAPVSDFDGIDAGHVKRAWEAATLAERKVSDKLEAALKAMLYKYGAYACDICEGADAALAEVAAIRKQK